MTTANSVNMKFDNGKNFNVTISKSGTPTYSGGPNGSIQIANAGSFGYSPNLTWTNNTLLAQNANIPGNVTFGNVGNITIGGGAPLQFLQTDGYGHLNWVTPQISAPGNIGELTWNDGNGNITTTDLLRWSNTGTRQLQAAGNIVPYTDVSYDLGTPALRWRDLYLSGNTINLGGVTISSTAGAIDIGNISADQLSANSATVGNLTATTLSATVTQASQPQITEVGTLQSLTVAGNVTLLGADSLTANFIGGQLTTAAQPQITEVGILANLTVGGPLQSDSITTNFINTPTMLVDNLVMPPFSDTNMGNSVTANYFIGDGSLLSNLQVGPWIANGGANLSVSSTQITAVIGGNTPLTVTSGGVTHTNTTTGNLVAANISTTSANITTLVTGDSNIGNLLIRDNLTVEDDVLITGNTLLPNLQVQLNLQSDGLLMAQTANIVTYNNVGTANLGPVGNVRISGGDIGQVLATDGTGNLYWTFSGGGGGGGNTIAQGNSFVRVYPNGNVGVTVSSTANVALFSNNTTILQELQVTGDANLGGIANITITGGNVGDVLSTDGSGNLTWAPAIVPGGIIAVEEVIATGGQTQFTAVNTPSGSAMLWINGVSVSPLAVSVANKTITYTSANNGGYTIEAGDEVTWSYVWSSSGTFRSESYTAADGQTVFTVVQQPRGTVIMATNGVLVRPGAVAVAGSTITYTPANNSGYQLIAGDTVSFSYIEI